jgi:hypothetical protein
MGREPYAQAGRIAEPRQWATVPWLMARLRPQGAGFGAGPLGSGAGFQG